MSEVIEAIRPSRALPASPSLEQQKKQARELLRAARAAEPAALERLRAHHPRYAGRRSHLLAEGLSWAARNNALDAMGYLIDRGADIDATAYRQEPGRATALHLAAQTDDPALVQLLLDHGADRTIRDENYNGDPAGWAEHTGSLRTLALLREGS